MPKLKTRKTVAKRFRRTRRGKLLHLHAGGSHLLQDKSRRFKRRQRRPEALENPGLARRLAPHARD